MSGDRETQGAALALNGVFPSDSRSYVLRLYVAGQSRKSIAAMSNLKAICESRLEGRRRIEVIDLLEQPDLAKRDQIVVAPTLVRHLPLPAKKIIGDLSDVDRVLAELVMGDSEAESRGVDGPGSGRMAAPAPSPAERDQNER